MRVAIINFPGTNCERDTKYAFDLLGFDSEIIWHKETELSPLFCKAARKAECLLDGAF